MKRIRSRLWKRLRTGAYLVVSSVLLVEIGDDDQQQLHVALGRHPVQLGQGVLGRLPGGGAAHVEIVVVRDCVGALPGQVHQDVDP